MQTKNIRRECKSVNDTHTDKQMTGIMCFHYSGKPEKDLLRGIIVRKSGRFWKNLETKRNFQLSVQFSRK